MSKYFTRFEKRFSEGVPLLFKWGRLELFIHYYPDRSCVIIDCDIEYNKENNMFESNIKYTISTYERTDQHVNVYKFFELMLKALRLKFVFKLESYEQVADKSTIKVDENINCFFSDLLKSLIDDMFIEKANDELFIKIREKLES
jgi:hypothetical protein